VSSTRLDPAELRRIAGKFESERLEIERHLATIRRWVETTRPAWTGKAGLGYQSVNEMWGEQQDRLLRLLQEVTELVRVHAGESEAATDQAAQAVKIQLPL
jgi:WXG100 family type VII secretion target